MRRLLWILVLLVGCSSALAADVEIARWHGAPDDAVLEEARAAPEVSWQSADALRKQPVPSWWRLRLTGMPSTPVGEDWIVALKELYDGELIAYLPPDYRPLKLHTFDPALSQIGSRHRLALQLPQAVAAQPMYLRFIRGRMQPIRASTAPVSEYVQSDLGRVRLTSMVLSALVLFGVVAVLYAVALRRWMLLMFCAWVASSAIYTAVMSGEVVWLVDDPGILGHAMRISSVAINLGTIAAYSFLGSFLGLRQRHPRLWQFNRVLLWLTFGLTLVVVFEPASLIANQLINLSVVGLTFSTIGAALIQARRGSPEGWFFLLGWGAVMVIGMLRAAYFFRYQGTPDWLEVAHPATHAFAALVLILATARAARYAEREMQVARTVARIDPLTRLPNRAELDRGLANLLAECERDDRPLCLMFLDIDHFKSINDRFGHAIGDQCLTAVGSLLRSQLRASDLVARYGGEEFVAVLAGMTPARAVETAESLRSVVAAEARERVGLPVTLTVSIGLTERRSGDNSDVLLRRADQALYQAKNAGRDRVCADFSAAESAS